MFMDISSELVHSLLPIFMSSVLGASMLTIGLVEGFAEASAAITKVFSGVLSDHWHKRKALVVLGYGLSAATKPLFPLASAIGWVAGARFVDRIGKGVRGAPRDALVADITPPRLRGGAYGLRQALDTTGAFVGPLSAIAFMALLGDDIRAVLWIAVVPAVAAVVLLVAAVREPVSTTKVHLPISLRNVTRFGRPFWWVVVLGTVFTLARFSEAFLILRAQDAGLTVGQVPLVLVIMNAFYMAGAYPAGATADRLEPKGLLLWGLGVLIAADLVLAAAPSVGAVLVGAGLWGMHMALTQGLFLKLIADAAARELRGTAFGVFNLASGLALLAASVVAGALWSSVGPSATFAVGAAFATVAGIGLMIYRPVGERAYEAE
jgi:MFS family permease